MNDNVSNVMKRVAIGAGMVSLLIVTWKLGYNRGQVDLVINQGKKNGNLYDCFDWG